MPVDLVITGDYKEMSKDLRAIKSALPRIASRAINELATYARKATIDETASDLRVPRKVIAKTKRRGNEVDRFRLTKATESLLQARLAARSDGIQVTDVAGAWIGRKRGQGGGVKAKGGRFYKGAFIAPAPSGQPRVWKRSPGKKRLPIFLPRIGTRQTMLKAMSDKVNSGEGVRVFRQRFDRMARLELSRRGLA